MYRFYIAASQKQGNTIEITGEDVNHIKNVLRMKQGERFILCDGEGT
ncbi:MAG: RNA methyltransferase PUA domain-containing protein, partial [Lachnospiraceae bacterium]